MKITAHSRYGIRLLIDLAEHYNESHVTMASIAERQNISVGYLEQVAAILRRTGFIRSVKGASGGYTLAYDPQEIIIGDVLNVLEGDIHIINPPPQGKTENPLRSCIRRAVYDPLNDRISTFLNSLTLASVLGTTDPDEAYMYFI